MPPLYTKFGYSIREEGDSDLADVAPLRGSEGELVDEDAREVIYADHSLPSNPNPSPSDGKVYPASFNCVH